MKPYPENDFATWEERDAAVDSVRTLPGWEVKITLERFSISVYIFQGNYSDLLEPITRFKKAETFIELHDVRNADDLEFFFKYVTRLVHNFLAAAMTLVDHCRILVRDFYAAEKYAEFVAEYELKKTEYFVENPLHQFIQRLRNYILHVALPIVGSTMNLNNFTSHLIIQYSSLKESSFKWGHYAGIFLEGKQETGELEELITEYYNLVISFYDWFHNRQMEVHAEELNELNALNERVQNSRWTPKVR